MRTIIQLFEESVQKYSDNPFLWENTTGKYESTSYKQTLDIVRTYSAGLLSLGIKKGDRVALLAEGQNNWIFSELALVYIGAVDVPLSVKLEPAEVEFRLKHSGARMVIVSNRQANKVEQIRNNCPELEKVIYLKPNDNKTENDLLWQDIYNLGLEYNKTNPDAVDNAKKQVTNNDSANITYTSGTTAEPKGVMLSHRNYTANVEQALTLMNIPEYFRTLLILPLDHCFAHVAGIYSFMASGASIATVELGNSPMQTLKNIPKSIQAIQPNLLLSVPALAKNFKKNIEKGIADQGKFKKNLFDFAIKTAYRYNKEGYNKGKGLSFLLYPLVRLFDKILFSKVRNFFGGKLEFFIGGGALLDIELQRFYYAIGIPMMQGYGLSEATPIIASNSVKKHKLGSSGHLVTPIDIKIIDDNGNELPVGEKGEILVKGENVMQGYWKNEQSTAETIKNGWLHTGDMGYLDKDNFLYVLGRFKSLLISHDGEKYSPESIEELLVSQSPFIDQAMLHNNQNPYTIGLIVPNKEILKNHIESKGLLLESTEGKEEALKIIQQEVNHYKKGGKHSGLFPECWLPSAIAVLEEPFSEQNKFINSTMKMVRGKITDFYQNRIDYLYTPEAKNIVNKENLESLNQLYK